MTQYLQGTERRFMPGARGIIADGWLPSAISNAIRWGRADNVVGSSPVTQSTDYLGNHDLTNQGTPVLDTTTLSYPYITFVDGDNENLHKNPVSGPASYHLFMVVDATGSSVGDMLLDVASPATYYKIGIGVVAGGGAEFGLFGTSTGPILASGRLVSAGWTWVEGFIQQRTTNAITKFEDAGDSTHVIVTSAGHSISENELIEITGTLNYNAQFTATNVDATTFEITATWAGDDAAGTVNGNLSSIVTNDNAIVYGPLDAPSMSFIAIGARDNTASGAEAKIAEDIECNGEVSAEDLASLRAYITSRYGIATL